MYYGGFFDEIARWGGGGSFRFFSHRLPGLTEIETPFPHVKEMTLRLLIIRFIHFITLLENYPTRLYYLSFLPLPRCEFSVRRRFIPAVSAFYLQLKRQLATSCIVFGERSSFIPWGTENEKERKSEGNFNKHRRDRQFISASLSLSLSLSRSLATRAPEIEYGVGYSYRYVSGDALARSLARAKLSC